MNIGCIALVTNRGGQLLGIDCNKGRGIILPGGKWDGPHETYMQCVLRELREETGLLGREPKLIFQAPDGFGYHVLAFHVKVDDFSTLCYGEMQAQTVSFAELKKSKYGAYYELLEQAWASYVKAGVNN
jgi:8-oxo-dGTP pyrophosphatase MutT (NUDIX family)